MTYFIQDLQKYLIDNGFAIDYIETYNVSGSEPLTCISVYDTDPIKGRYSIQFLRIDKAPAKCLSRLSSIYNFFFDYKQQKLVYRDINRGKCLFKPVSKPLFLKLDNGLVYYTFNIEVYAQK